MARATNKGNRDAGSDRVEVYSTKLYSDTKNTIKYLTKAGKVIYGDGYTERQLLEDAIELYQEARPEVCQAAEKLKAVEEAIKESI